MKAGPYEERCSLSEDPSLKTSSYLQSLLRGKLHAALTNCFARRLTGHYKIVVSQ